MRRPGLLLLLVLLVACGDIFAGHDDPYAEARRETVARINQFRATVGLPALAERNSAAECADAQAKADSQSGTAHGAFGQCQESAQNECPGWPTVASIASGCLQAMWNEGPGSDYATHGHYINMTNTSYHKVAVGFYETPSHQVWAVMDFSR